MLSVVFADIHINTSKYPDYEERKVSLIRKAIKESKADKVVFAGDIFDRNRPSMEDIRLFYQLVEGLHKPIHIIAGNHDHTTFEFLPQTSFTYHSEITVMEDGVVYIPWTNIHDNFPDGIICYSHARCNVPPHIVEEVNIQKFSDRYSLTILGDIHSPMAPFDNVVYTSSPVPIHFKAYQKNTSGYLLVDETSATYTRKYINGLAKIKIVTSALKLGDTLNNLRTKGAVGNLYKVVVEDYPEKLAGIQKWATKSIRIEPKVLLRKEEVYDKVKEVLDQSLSIEEVLYDYLKDNYKYFSVDMENELKRNIHE